MCVYVHVVLFLCAHACMHKEVCRWMHSLKVPKPKALTTKPLMRQASADSHQLLLGANGLRAIGTMEVKLRV